MRRKVAGVAHCYDPPQETIAIRGKADIIRFVFLVRITHRISNGKNRCKLGLALEIRPRRQAGPSRVTQV